MTLRIALLLASLLLALPVSAQPQENFLIFMADDVGLTFGRTCVLNDDPVVLGALADRVLGAAP